MPGDPLTFWSVFFQLAAGIVLLFRRGEPRWPVRILAVMLLLNAAVSAIWFQSFWPPWDDGRRVAAAFDAPTEVLVFALLASLSPAPWARKAMFGLFGLAAVVGAVAPFMYSVPHTSLTRGFEQFRSAVFFVGLTLVCFRLAGGAEPWQRWAALAFLPRGLYWAVAGGGAVLTVLAGAGDPKGILLLLTVPFLAAGCLLAIARLLRRPSPPTRMVAVLVPLTGVAIALAEFGVRSAQPVDPILVPMLSLITLGVHRPLFLLVGLAPSVLRSVAGRSVVAAAVGSVALVGLDTFYPGAPGAAVLTGFVSGAMALAVMEVLWPRLETWDAPDAPAPAPFFALHRGQVALGAPSPSPPPALAQPKPAAPVEAPEPARPASGRPQWQDLVLAMRGSCLGPEQAVRGDSALTQKALVERTGIRASRVSTIMRELNDEAAGRLDAYVPGWRAAHPRVAEAKIVQQFRGSVPGLAGVWVYYRLTPLGEMLAEALAAAEPWDALPGVIPSERPPDGPAHVPTVGGELRRPPSELERNSSPP